MSKKDYERAAEIAQEWRRASGVEPNVAAGIVEAFVELFKGDNARFDEGRFRRACEPGVNVRSRTGARKDKSWTGGIGL